MMDWLAERFAPGPFFGWLCVVFAVLIPFIWIRARRKETKRALRFSTAGFVKPYAGTWASKMQFSIPLLRTLAVIALIAALARPQAGGEYHASKEGIAIQMVLDVSGSMAEEDFIIEGRRARRLDAVKLVFEDFVLGDKDLRGRENDLIGMTTFAMYGDTRCPLTLDHGSLIDLLRDTEIPGWTNGRQVRREEESDYTALGDAIALGADDLRRAGELAAVGVPGAEPAKSRIMILLTDGQDNPAEQFKHTSPNPVEAAKVASKMGIKIYTIGAVGSAPVNRGFFATRRAQVDEPTLKEVAQVTGGKYFRATDTDSLITVYDEIDRLERVVTGERSYQDDVVASRIAMLVGFGLLLFEAFLTNTRFRRLP